MKKWWFPFYSWALSVSAVNGWRLRMKVTGKKEPFLDFLRELVIQMVATHGHPPMKITGSRVLNEIRYDGLNHWIQEVEMGPKEKLRKNCKLCYDEKKPPMSAKNARWGCTFRALRLFLLSIAIYTWD